MIKANKKDEPEQEFIPASDAKEVAPFSVIEAGLAALRKEFDGKVPDCKTKKGYEDCGAAYRLIRKSETLLENTRKEKGRKITKEKTDLDAEARRINTELMAISSPYKEAHDNRKTELENIESGRLENIQGKIESIGAFLDSAVGQDAETIGNIINDATSVDTSTGFDEFSAEAERKKADVLASLGDKMRDKLSLEQAQAAAKAAAITEKISNLKSIPVDFIGLGSAEISQKIEDLSSFEVCENVFGDRAVEVAALLAGTVAKLDKIRLQAIGEEDQAKKDTAAAVLIQDETDARKEDGNRDLIAATASREADQNAKNARRLAVETDAHGMDEAINEAAKAEIRTQEAATEATRVSEELAMLVEAHEMNAAYNREADTKNKSKKMRQTKEDIMKVKDVTDVQAKAIVKLLVTQNIRNTTYKF